jgi:hypothetical protein
MTPARRAAMALLAALLCGAVVLSGCSHSTSPNVGGTGCTGSCSGSTGGSGQSATTPTGPSGPSGNSADRSSVHPQPPDPQGSASRHYTDQTTAIAASCLAFEHFYSDVVRAGPRGTPQQQLVDAVALMLIPLARADPGVLTAKGLQLQTDGKALLARVGSSAWPKHGSTIDPAIVAVQRDCNQH